MGRGWKRVATIPRQSFTRQLFFKWIKQHLPATKIHCTSPQGIWNEMFLAMIAYCLSLYIRLTVQTRKTQWQIHRMIKDYAHQTWDIFERALKRKPTRTSRGRQKVERPPKVQSNLSSNVAIVE